MDQQLSNLINRIKSGDEDAFSLIVRTYHDVTIHWAKAITRDVYQAEDVAQEAFLRMRDKIGQLQVPEKFPSWFRQMVRRIAMNHIRGLAREELPVGEVTDPEDVFGETQKESDPLHQMILCENESELLYNSLDRLPEQTRSLLTSFALEDATPEQLAARFNMKKSNVYNILSRSRSKANDERFRHEVERHLKERRRQGLPAFRQLHSPRYSHPYALISILIAEVLRIAGEPYWTVTDLMGISGDAFRLNITTGCNWQGISTFDWSYSTYQTLERLGFSGTCYGRPGRKSISPEQQITVLSTIQDTIDRGLPAIIWNLVINEFGFVYGYNDDNQTIFYMGYDRKERTFRYERLGRTAQEPALFVMAIKKRVASPASIDKILALIVNHAKGKEPPVPGFEFGLQGYRLWLEAVEGERLDLHGHAYQVAILAEARNQGALYLQGLSEKANGFERKKKFDRAAGCYRRVSDAFSRIYPSFPFGFGGSNAGRSASIREGLLAACEAEKEGISLLESLIR